MGALTRDQRHVRETLSPYDLMFCIGSDVLRMSVFSETDPMPDGMALVQIGLRDWEMGKNYPAEIALRADVKDTLVALASLIERKRGAEGARKAAAAIAALKTSNWSANREAVRADALEGAGETPMPPDLAMLLIVDALSGMTAPMVLDGAMHGAAFLAYVDKVLVPTLEPGDIVVMDNLPRPSQRRRPRGHLPGRGRAPLPAAPTAPISIRSRWPSPSSRPTSSAAPPAPSPNSGRPSATPQTSSPRPSAKTTSLLQDTIVCERNML